MNIVFSFKIKIALRVAFSFKNIYFSRKFTESVTKGTQNRTKVQNICIVENTETDTYTCICIYMYIYNINRYTYKYKGEILSKR